jgi:hypothetical protein
LGERRCAGGGERERRGRRSGDMPPPRRRAAGDGERRDEDTFLFDYISDLDIFVVIWKHELYLFMSFTHL